MKRHALIVSHGQPSEPEVGEAEITAMAAEVAKNLPGWAVHGVTLSGKGTLETAVANLPEGTPVYPLFMADGWFTQTVLPRRLGSARVTMMEPFGIDPELPGIAADAIRRSVTLTDSHAHEILVAGHGSGKSPRPAQVTREFAARLSGLLARPVRCGFVEEAQFLAEAAKGMAPGSICLPFFATRRGHVLEDIPQALSETGFDGTLMEPLGCLPAIPALIARRFSTTG